MPWRRMGRGGTVPRSNIGASRPSYFTQGERALGKQRTGGGVGPSASLDAMAKRKNPFPAPVGNRIPVVEPAAQSLYLGSLKTSN
jgi:hypothetical protein